MNLFKGIISGKFKGKKWDVLEAGLGLAASLAGVIGGVFALKSLTDKPEEALPEEINENEVDVEVTEPEEAAEEEETK